MNRLLLIILLLLIRGGLTLSQGLYFKLFPGYNFSVSAQQMPDYLTHQVMIPTGTGFGRQNVNLNDPEFSVASGVNLSAAAGYEVNDFLSVELRLSGFANTRKQFEAAGRDLMNGETEWDFRSLSVMPAIVFGKTVNKTSLNIYAFSGIGAADLRVTTIIEGDRRRFEFDRAPLFSWGFGLEFCYALSRKLSLFAEAGITSSYYYKPDRAHLVSSTLIPAEDFMTYQKEFVYRDEITNISTDPYGMPDPNSPDTRLRETLRSNSLAAGIGIKITPWK